MTKKTEDIDLKNRVSEITAFKSTEQDKRIYFTLSNPSRLPKVTSMFAGHRNHHQSEKDYVYYVSHQADKVLEDEYLQYAPFWAKETYSDKSNCPHWRWRDSLDIVIEKTVFASRICIKKHKRPGKITNIITFVVDVEGMGDEGVIRLYL